MSLKAGTRNYSMLDANLCMFVSNMCNTLTRDLDNLSVFGLSAPDIGELKALCDAFEVFPHDATFHGNIMIANEKKDALRNQILEIMRNMGLRAEAKWGAKSPKYKRLNLNYPTRLKDENLVVTSRDMQAKMKEYLPEMVDLGLTQQILDDWAELNDSFDSARNELADAVSKRDEMTTERIAKGNELYALVVKYCSFGKRVYEKTNPPYYNDYVIYRKIRGKVKKKGKKPSEDNEKMETVDDES